MDKQKIHYCFTLSEEQVEYLRSKKYKIDRMECFMSLVTLAVRETKLEQLSKTQQVEILPGQFMVDNTELARLWDKDRKTVPKLLEAMERLGISSSQKVGENRIHTLHVLSGWYIDAKFKANSFAVKRNAGETAIIHADVPAPKVITVEVEETKNRDARNADAVNGKSKDGSVGTNPSPHDSAPQLSPPSADGAAVGKSLADGSSSLFSSDGISPQGDGARTSADNASARHEADSKQNEGKSTLSPSQRSPAQQGNVKQSFNGNIQKPCGNPYQNGYNPR